MFTINRHLDKATLVPGTAYVQFCIFPNDNPGLIKWKNLTADGRPPGLHRQLIRWGGRPALSPGR